MIVYTCVYYYVPYSIFHRIYIGQIITTDLFLCITLRFNSKLNLIMHFLITLLTAVFKGMPSLISTITKVIQDKTNPSRLRMAAVNALTRMPKEVTHRVSRVLIMYYRNT